MGFHATEKVAWEQITLSTYAPWLYNLGESYTKNNNLCILEGKENFHRKRRFGCQKQPVKIPTPNLVLHLLWHVPPPHKKNQFFAYISINMSPGGKLQDTPNIPHKISYMIVSLKVILGLLVRRKTSLEITNFIIFAYMEKNTCRRNFHTIKFVCSPTQAHIPNVLFWNPTLLRLLHGECVRTAPLVA